ncbi:hypothetical protein ACQV5M_21250, partial [Leptospira sp. SA-E8]
MSFISPSALIKPVSYSVSEAVTTVDESVGGDVDAASPQQVRIDLRESEGDRSYPIFIGGGLLSWSASFAGLPKASQALIITNTTVAPLYAETLKQALQAHHARVHVLELPDGEQHKDWPTLNLIFD